MLINYITRVKNSHKVTNYKVIFVVNDYCVLECSSGLVILNTVTKNWSKIIDVPSYQMVFVVEKKYLAMVSGFREVSVIDMTLEVDDWQVKKHILNVTGIAFSQNSMIYERFYVPVFGTSTFLTKIGGTFALFNFDTKSLHLSSHLPAPISPTFAIIEQNSDLAARAVLISLKDNVCRVLRIAFTSSNFTNPISDLLKQQLTNGTTDVTLTGSNGTVCAHKLIIFAIAPDLLSKFDEQSSTISMPNFDVSVLTALVEFIYTFRISNLTASTPKSFIEQLKAAASFGGVFHLAALCDKILNKQQPALKNSNSHELQIKKLMSQGDYSAAQQLVTVGLNQSPNNPKFNAQQANLYALKGCIVEALVCMSKALDNDPFNIGYDRILNMYYSLLIEGNSFEHKDYVKQVNDNKELLAQVKETAQSKKIIALINNKEAFPNVEFKVENETVYAHRFFLSLHGSEFFKNLFETVDMGTIVTFDTSVIPNLTAKVFKQFLEYMYTFAVPIFSFNSQEELFLFIKCAHFFDVPHFAHLVESYLALNPNINDPQLYEFAIFNNCDILKQEIDRRLFEESSGLSEAEDLAEEEIQQLQSSANKQEVDDASLTKKKKKNRIHSPVVNVITPTAAFSLASLPRHCTPFLNSKRNRYSSIDNFTLLGNAEATQHCEITLTNLNQYLSQGAFWIKKPLHISSVGPVSNLPSIEFEVNVASAFEGQDVQFAIQRNSPFAITVDSKYSLLMLRFVCTSNMEQCKNQNSAILQSSSSVNVPIVKNNVNFTCSISFLQYEKNAYHMLLLVSSKQVQEDFKVANVICKSTLVTCDFENFAQNTCNFQYYMGLLSCNEYEHLSQVTVNKLEYQFKSRDEVLGKLVINENQTIPVSCGNRFCNTKCFELAKMNDGTCRKHSVELEFRSDYDDSGYYSVRNNRLRKNTNHVVLVL